MWQDQTMKPTAGHNEELSNCQYALPTAHVFVVNADQSFFTRQWKIYTLKN